MTNNVLASHDTDANMTKEIMLHLVLIALTSEMNDTIGNQFGIRLHLCQ